MSARMLTDAERVDVLLDENQRLRKMAAYRLQEDGDNLAKLLAIRDAPVKEGMAVLRRELAEGREKLATVRQDLAISEAANDALREALRKSEVELQDALVAHYAAEAECVQLRRERDEALAQLDRPSRTYTLGRLVGTAIGVFLVAIPVGGVIEAVGRQVGSW